MMKKKPVVSIIPSIGDALGQIDPEIGVCSKIVTPIPINNKNQSEMIAP